MSRSKIYARNLTANWVAYFVNLAVMFLLSPFVVNTLGDVRYGVWSLLISLTGYFGLIDIGIRASLGRFINFYLGRDDIPKVNGIISTATVCFSIASLVVLAAAGILATFLDVLFTKLPVELLPDARLAIVLIALNMALTFFVAINAQVLFAVERFDLGRGVMICVLLIRAAGTVLVLSRGGGLVELAVVQLLSNAVGLAAGYVLAKRVFSPLTIRLSLSTASHGRELLAFGLWSFIGSIASQLLYMTDTVVIGILMPTKMITYYAIPLMLIQYGRGFIYNIGSVLRPQTIKASSVEDYEELRYLFNWGAKITLFLGIPLFAGLIFMGTDFMMLWQGHRFQDSRTVLILLAIPQFFVLATRPAGSIIAGLGYVRFGACLTLAQALMNLGLTLVFVMACGLGLEGVALGTLVPMIGFNCVLAMFVLRWIRFPLRRYLINNLLPWVVGGGAVAASFYAISSIRLPLQWSSFALKVTVMFVVGMPLAWYLMFSSAERALLWDRVKAIFSRSTSGR